LSETLLVLAPYLLFVLGAILGSFSNVIIYRWPRKENIALPASHCPHCQHTIAFYDNVPILGWFLLRGRCRHCKAKISWRYPLVETLMAVLFVLVWRTSGPTYLTIEYLILVFGLVTASFIDIDHFLLPDFITLSGLVIGLIGAFLNPERSFLDSVFGVLFGGGFLWAVAYLYFAIRKQEGMGGGDIKLLAWIGAVLGWKVIPFIIITASVLGTVLGLALAAKEKRSLKTVIPFGPYLAFGALVFVCGGQSFAYTYLRWFIPEL
jgi:leader peptidase (prepilin peptidase)/N-methyltransferase